MVAAATRYCSVYEVLVDDGSSGGTARLLERGLRSNPTVRLLRHGRNRRFVGEVTSSS
jgi:hypothetical protein